MSSFTEATFTQIGWRSFLRPDYVADVSFHYDIGCEGSPLRITVPKGFITDGPSLPWWVLILLPRGYRERLMKACAVHDELRENRAFTLLESDAIFMMALEASGFSWVEQLVGFLLVRTNRSRVRRNPIPSLA